MPKVDTKLVYNFSPLLPSIKDGNALYITDSNTTELLKKSENYSASIPHIELASGEENKTLTSIEKILKKAMEAGLNRDGKFVGVGGGVVLDMTGFASSIYMRGAVAIYVPTTLLSMVDAAIGGKTGVDFNEVKNLVGAFHLPKEVYICSDYLNTLSEVQYRSGLAEMLKIALINRPALYRTIAQHSNEIKTKISVAGKTVSSSTESSFFIELIKDAIDGKMEVVRSDFDEKGERTYLNFGHTFAHALEAASAFAGITHGEAVAWGISRALSLGVLLGKTDKQYRDEVVSLIASLGYSTEAIPENLRKILVSKVMNKERANVLSENVLRVESFVRNEGKAQAETNNEIASLLIEKMRSDKKNKTGKIRFVLQKNLGSTFTEEVDESYIREVLI